MGRFNGCAILSSYLNGRMIREGINSLSLRKYGLSRFYNSRRFARFGYDRRARDWWISLAALRVRGYPTCVYNRRTRRCVHPRFIRPTQELLILKVCWYWMEIWCLIILAMWLVQATPYGRWSPLLAGCSSRLQQQTRLFSSFKQLPKRSNWLIFRGVPSTPRLYDRIARKFRYRFSH